ncbi:C40 family peptidase [Caulobacter sp. NIBR2454]|uniref:C40 family peptidase n=1 Tax=Caulobacter sp. NIBR2454 TaxID=3015996 RepID=UPI0022B6C2A3|nr:NlpC/P60 family protein [Caulobacter sp. NIBR2454]
MSFDPRLTLARPDLAAVALEGLVRADLFAEPRRMVVTTPSTALRKAPAPDAEQWDQLLFGEAFDVLEETGGFCWGQAARDGYVGFVESAALGPVGASATHRVSAIRTYAFSAPDIKSKPVGLYSLNALVAVEAREGRFAKVADAGWFVEAHLAPLGEFDSDPAAVAERFIGAPYQWGGRESLGLDCSGLIQQALYACGRSCPRDTDMQAAGLGEPISPDQLRRGDLVFWKGHVVMMLDAARIVHANAHFMDVTIEPLADALARIGAVYGPPTAFRRP